MKNIDYSLSCSSSFGCVDYANGVLNFTANADSDCAKWTFSLEFKYWEEDAFIFSPACLYNGNRFPKNGRGWYAPMYQNNEMGENAKEYINNVPALNVDGSGLVEVASGDMATPCLAVYFNNAKKGVFVFFEQAVKGKNIGARIEKQKFTLQFPSDRDKQYRMLESKSGYSGECTIENRGVEDGACVSMGEKVCSKVLIKEIDCDSLPRFYEWFFKNRKILLAGERAKTVYDSALWQIMEDHFNSDNWSGEYYSGIDHSWQSGWFCGTMTGYAFKKLGSELSKSRAEKTLDFVPNTVAPSGLFFSKINKGVIESDARYATTKKGYENMIDAHLVRRSGDALYFLFKNFEVIKPKTAVLESARNCLDALVKIFEENGTFGQYVNVRTGKMLVSVSSCGAIIVGALAKAYQFFKDQKYLDTAIKAGQYYYDNFVKKGYTNGGPADILCAPDSESSYGMLEGLVSLYEVTKDEKWLGYAKDSAHIFSSWVMSYEYEWLTDCEFKKLGINTVGSIFASVQNKHSAPGVCTSSGDALYRLYKYSGETEYLELLKDIVYFLPQCVSTPQNPVYAYNYPHGDERGRLKYGYICERVNTSDWENPNWIGSVWNGSCWCEVSIVLTFADLMDKEEFKQ